MIILDIGYQDPTIIIRVEKTRDGEMRYHEYRLEHATLKEIAKHLDESQDIVVDSGQPREIEELQAMGFRVTAVRI